MAKPKKNELIYLQDIQECILRIQTYTENLTEAMFLANTEKQDAVIRRLEMIGEASKHISEATKVKYSHIPWREMAGMRDILIHHYSNVSVLLVWNVVKTELPKLKNEIEKIIHELTD